MANFTPDEMAAINEMARAGKLSDKDVQYFLGEMGAPMMPPTGAGATTDREMQALQAAMPPGEMPPTGAGATTDRELKFLMEMIQRPEVSEMLLGALPKGAVTDQEMQGVK